MRTLALGVVLLSAVAAAQTPAPPPAAPDGTQQVSMAPIECYWRTAAPAVRVGEVFGVVLTCGVIETAATTVVPDQSRLDPDVLQLQPFEVVGGSAAADLRTPTRRYFQYEYRVRYLGEEIGRDQNLPALTLNYRVQSRVQEGSAAIESRERQYVLPARPVRIVSLIPTIATDIREIPPPTFDEIRDRRFTARVLRIIAWVLFALAAIVGLWAVARALRQRRGHRATTVRLASDTAVLGGVARELAHVRSLRHADGWTDALAARALAALRVAANYEVARPVAQAVAGDTTAAPGQLRVPGRWPRGGAVLLSGSATGSHLSRERVRAESAGHARTRLADLEGALRTFAAAAYGRDHASLDASSLDEALEAGGRAVATLRRDHGWMATRLRAIAHSFSELRSRAWAR